MLFDKIYNKIITNQDLQVCIKYKEKYEYEKKYLRDDDFWNKQDSLSKWSSHLIMFDEIETPSMKVIDLGVGDSPVPHIISEKGHEVTGVDISNITFPYQSLVTLVIKDAMEFLIDYDEESIDLFFDGCAVTHFACGESDDYSIHKGWSSVCKSVEKILKPGGYFISSSDIMLEKRVREFLIPEQIVEIAEKSGLELYSNFCYDRDDALVRQEPFPGTLGVANFLFKKPLN